MKSQDHKNKIGVIIHTVFQDPRGILEKFVLSLNFIPAEVFIISNVPKGIVRGRHAHMKCSQLVVLRSGSIKLSLENQNGIQSFILSEPGSSFLINPLTWSSQEFLTEKTEIIVFCSEPYSEKDYIRDYNIFIEIIKSA